VKSKKMLMYNAEKNLILSSSICDKNKNLWSTLSRFKRGISKEDIDSIIGIDLDIYNLINTKEAVKVMKDDASLEWTPREHIGKVNIPCQLCGSILSEEKFIIRNSVNGNELQVGSSCIHLFDNMNSLLYGIPVSEVSRLSNLNPNKLKRIVAFNKLYPGGKSIFSNWKNKYDKFDITFPSSYDVDFNKIIKQGKKFYDSYTNNKISDDLINNFDGCIDDFNYLSTRCERFCNENRNNKYICNKKIE